MKAAKKQLQQVVQEEEDTAVSREVDMADEEEEQPFNDIDMLQEHGINMGDILKLKAAGLCTAISVLMCTKKDMLNIKGITDVKAEKLYEAAGKIEKTGFQTGLAILEKRKLIKRISTGSHQFDSLL